MDAEQLWDIEQIKQLKARYFRLMDRKQWSEWADVFTEDCEMWVEDSPRASLRGRDQIVDRVRRILDDGSSAHHGHMPEIELLSPTTARGTWAMFDYLELPRDDPKMTLRGFGHYEEEYEKEQDGTWRIKKLRLVRLRVDQSGDPAFLS